MVGFTNSTFNCGSLLSTSPAVSSSLAATDTLPVLVGYGLIDVATPNRGTLQVSNTTATTSTDIIVAALTATSSSTPAAGFGPALDFAGSDAGGNINQMCLIRAIYDVATAGAYNTSFQILARTNAASYAEGLRVSPAGISTNAGATYFKYEESTFTPVAAGSSTAGAGTYTAQVGRYFKIGQWVCIQYAIGWTAHTGTGSLRLQGLPYAIGSVPSGGNPAICGLQYDGTNFNSRIFQGSLGNSRFASITPGTSTADTIDNATRQYQFCITYYTGT